MTAHVAIRFHTAPLGQHLDLSAQIAFVDFLLHALLQTLQLQKARLFFPERYVIIKFGRRRAGPLRVLEDVERAITTLIDQRHSILKASLSLAGKADDDNTCYVQQAARDFNLINPTVIGRASVTYT